MRTSPAGIDLIKRHEGLMLNAYRDAAGVLTIGYGHTGPDVRPGLSITEHDADRLLTNDLLRAEREVGDCGRALTQRQFDALVSFHFNTGGFRPGTGIWRAVREGRDQDVDDEMRRWVHVTVDGKKRKLAGLVRRRADEAQLWLDGCESRHVAQGDATSIAEPDTRPVASHPGVVASGAITGGALLQQTAEQLEPLAGYSQAITVAFLALSLAGIAWTVWHAWSRR